MDRILAKEVLIHLAPCVDALPSVVDSVENLVIKTEFIHVEVPGTKSALCGRSGRSSDLLLLS